MLRFSAVPATLAAASLIAAAAVGLSSCDNAAKADAAPPAPQVTVANPLVQDAAAWTEHSGRFVASQSVDIRPRISGYLRAAHFTEGQFVRQGQLLFTLDPLPQQAESDRSRAELAQAQARVDRAENDLRRAARLREKDFLSAEAYDIRKEALDQAIAARNAAQAGLRANNLDLGYTRIYAPISGRISDRRVDPGNLVQDGQTVLTQIVAVSPIHFEFAGDENLLAGAAGAREVKVRLDGETDFAHPGRLDFIDNHIEAQTGALRARAVFDNQGGQFTPGQFARVRVYGHERKPVVLAPETAIAADQSRKYVLVVNANNLVEYRPVELGAKMGPLRIITAGLKPSDRLIINGQQRAMPGTPVAPVAGKIAAAASAIG